MTAIDGASRAQAALGSGTVLQFSTMVPPTRFGGAERVVEWFTDQLESAGWRVHNAGLADRRSAREGGSAHPIRNIYWPFDGRQRDIVRRTAWHAIDTLALAARGQVEALVDDVAPTVIVTHNLRGWGYAPWVVAGERGIPLVHVVHDYGLLCNSSTLWRGTACDRICRACAPRRDSVDRRWPGGSVVGVSRSVVTEHGRHGIDFARAARVIYPTEAAATSPARTDRRERHDGVPVVLGFVGRVNDAKGLDVLLGAVRGRPQRLLVAGDGDRSLVSSLRARSPANVEWVGWVDPSEFLDGVDVLVVPSVWKEPFGLVVVEAARAGVPLLLSDRPGLVEAAQASGARFSTFRAGSQDDLRTALGRSTSEYASESVSEETVDLIDLIRQVAAHGNGGPQRGTRRAQPTV